jgi:hypothetical protein
MKSAHSFDRLAKWLSHSRVDLLLGTYFLAQLVAFLGLESTPGMLDRQGRVRGRDFLQFYVAGQIVARGEAHRLYDQQYFIQVQRSLLGADENREPYLSIYPANVALLFSPLSRLSYGNAILIWWLIQAACFLTAGCLLRRTLDPLPSWRHTAWLGLMSFFPVMSTFWFGQLAALLLLAWVAGLELCRIGRPFSGGCVLSLLAMKPQLAAGVLFWLVLRRDVRALGGLCLGVVLQAWVVAISLPPEVFAPFAAYKRLFAQNLVIYRFAPDLEHATAGILTDLLGEAYGRWAMLVHLTLAAGAASLLFRIVRKHHKDLGLVESSAAVLFALLASPHLLTYDLTYLLIPLTYLLSGRRTACSPELPMPESLLYLCATLTPLYGLLGFSIVPIVLLGTLHSLTRAKPEGSSQGTATEG